MDLISIKVVAFDVFGTVFDLSGVPRKELKAYAAHIRQPEWSPLVLPSHWERLSAHPDSAEGVNRLRSRYAVVTCSNGPLGLLAKLSKYNGVQWDAIIPLELNRVFKPNPAAYLTVCEVMGVAPGEVLLVTANRTFGDLEAASALGMQAQLIRDVGCPQDIIELARMMGVS